MTIYADQLQTFSLAGSGAIAGATSVVLKSMRTIDGELVVMADFGTIGYGTIEPGSGELEEQISFTGITQNANGTATLTGVKTVLFKQPFTETSGLEKTHAGSSVFVISNTSGFYGRIPFKDNDEVITGQWEFETFPITPSVPLASESVAGSVELATDQEVLDKESDGSVGPLVVRPSQLASTLLSDYKADTGAANAYVIAPVPAITGYTAGQIFSFKAANANTGASTLAVNGFSATAIKKSGGSADLAIGDIVAGQIVVVEYDGTNFQMINPSGNLAIRKFGGTGADGALAISSGTTNIDLAGASVVVKNYTSISITGTGALTFSNPAATGTIIILKSLGNVVITSSATRAIDLRSLGGTAGAAGAIGGNGAGGNPGATSLGAISGGGGGGTSADPSGIGGAGGVGFLNGGVLRINGKAVPFGCGGGGGGGGGSTVGGNSGGGGGGGGSMTNTGENGGDDDSGSTNGAGGAGGRGAGALYIECGGALNITGTIDASGVAGAAAGAGGAGAGGGGGGGGSIVIVYSTLTANTGVYTVTAGAAGAGAGSGGDGGAGGTGASLVAQNTELV